MEIEMIVGQVAVYLFDCLHKATETMEGKALYLLTLICAAMAVDFVVGSLSAWRNPNIKFTSERGINGILRKLASILVLVLCIPVSALIPMEAGMISLIVLYIGYLVMELASIVENLDELGVPVAPLLSFIENVKEVAHHEEGNGDKHD